MSVATARESFGRGPDGRVISWSTPVYRLGRALVTLWLLVLHRRVVERRELLPREGGCLLVSNHQSFLDIPLIASATGRHVAFVARDSLARSRFLAWVMHHSGVVLIERGKPDRRALREMVEHLEAGDCVAIFPEGTRSTDGRVGDFAGGAFLAARQAGVPVVPAGIRGSVEALPKGGRLRAARVALRFGEPMDGRDPETPARTQALVEEMVGDGRFGSVPRVS